MVRKKLSTDEEIHRGRNAEPDYVATYHDRLARPRQMVAKTPVSEHHSQKFRSGSVFADRSDRSTAAPVQVKGPGLDSTG